MDRTALTDAVETAFAATSRGLRPWPNPRPTGTAPHEEEYSRILDPAKYRLLGARFEAWAQVLEAQGLCHRLRDVDSAWREKPSVFATRTERLDPVRPGALSLVAIHSRIDDCLEAGVVIGAGNPATAVAVIPACGCDACDDGSDPLLEEIDDSVWGLVSGAFIEVRQGDRWVRTLGDLWRAEGLEHDEPEAWLADPGDRDVTRGAAWEAG